MTTLDDRTAQWIAARRLVAWQHHPDRGGDPQAFTRELDRVDAQFGRTRTGGVVQHPRPRRRMPRRRMPRHRARIAGKRLRRVLTRRSVRSRRYIEL